MASKTARPGRRLIVFGLVVAALYGGVALSGEWKPKLGLDLQGGTRITLEARTENGQKPDAASLEEARGIIDQRVNGSGVAEAEVSTQGGQNIVVEVPGPPRGDLVDTVKQTAQLRFRLVALQAPGQPQASPSASPKGVGQRLRLPERLRVARRVDVRRLDREAVADRHAEGTPAVRRRAPRQGQAVGHARPRSPARRRAAVAVRGRLRRAVGRADGEPRRRPGRPAAEVDGQPGHEVAQGVHRVHLPDAATRPPPRSTTTSRSRWSPVTRTATSCCCPPRSSRAPS